MREFVFALDYEPESNPIADILADAPDTQLRSLSCHVTADTLWRVDHITGSESTLDSVAEAVATADYYADCLVRRDCQGEWETRVLDRSADTPSSTRIGSEPSRVLPSPISLSNTSATASSSRRSGAAAGTNGG